MTKKSEADVEKCPLCDRAAEECKKSPCAPVQNATGPDADGSGD